MMSIFEPKVRSCEKIATVIGCVERASVSATGRSFQVNQELEDPERGDRGQGGILARRRASAPTRLGMLPLARTALGLCARVSPSLPVRERNATSIASSR
jgi:hypothetical protein